MLISGGAGCWDGGLERSCDKDGRKNTELICHISSQSDALLICVPAGLEL